VNSLDVTAENRRAQYNRKINDARNAWIVVWLLAIPLAIIAVAFLVLHSL
jgi:hypothetical protein